MALKHLIVHLDQAESAPERLRLAANLALRHGCRLTAIYVREPNEAQRHLQRTAELSRASGEEFDRIHEQVRLSIDNGATRLQSELEALQREQGIEVAWRSVDGIASKVVPQHARFADLCIVADRVHSTHNLSEKLLSCPGDRWCLSRERSGQKCLEAISSWPGTQAVRRPARSPTPCRS